MKSDSLKNKSIQIHIAHLSTKDFYSLGHRWAQQLSDKTALRFLRGDRMRTYGSLFDEFAAALQFPYYFGKNWAALDECMADLDWMPAESYLLMFCGAESICGDEPSSEHPPLLKILSKVGSDWSKPITGSGSLDRPAKPFHCAFQCDGSHRIEDHLRKASIEFDLLENR